MPFFCAAQQGPLGWSKKKKCLSLSISYAEMKFQSDDIKIFVAYFFRYSVFPHCFQCWESLLLAYIGLDMDSYVRYTLGCHLLMIRNDCLDLLTPKEALATFVHNMLNKQFFRHIGPLYISIRVKKSNCFYLSWYAYH